MNKIEYKRKCPECGGKIDYKYKLTYDRAEKNNSKCKVCSNSGKNNGMYGKVRTNS